MLTAIINGAGRALVWVSQGKFMALCACEENKGFFNSIFWSFFAFANTFGSLIAALILKNEANLTTLFLIFAAIASIATMIYTCLGTPKKLSDAED